MWFDIKMCTLHEGESDFRQGNLVLKEMIAIFHIFSIYSQLSRSNTTRGSCTDISVLIASSCLAKDLFIFQ